jgi:hypothetical protein
MTVKRPSAVDGLRRGVGTTVTAPASQTAHTRGQFDAGTPKPPKPARITLNLPPELYRQLTRWADSAAEAIDVPRVGVQEALRAMVRVITEGQAKNAEQQVYAAIRDELTR